MNKISRMILNNEIGDMCKIMVSLHNINISNLPRSQQDDFSNTLYRCNNKIARAIQCIQFQQDYTTAIEHLDGVGELITKLVSYQVN